MFEIADISTYFPMLLNSIMVAAIAGLWLAWWRNTKRHSQVEAMLVDSARQLQEASEHLEQAMAQINSTPIQKEVSHQRTAHQEKTSTVASVPGDARIAHMLRMQREGIPSEDIANKLNLPLSQVSLALKLHVVNMHP